MKIYAPVKDFNGWRNNVRFVNGVGETYDPIGIDWFMSRGYKCEKCDYSYPIPQEKCDDVGKNTEKTNVLDEVLADSDEPDFDAMNPNELREWAKANGLGLEIKNIRNKEKLLEIIRG